MSSSLTWKTRLRETWQWSYGQVATGLYFDSVRCRKTAPLPKGPILFVGTHRNGIVDALVYSHALGRMTFVLASRLQKTWAGRLFFGGIGVVRDKDGADRSGNSGALDEAADHLARGGNLFMFPEGTSALGPRLLDIKPGAARIVADCLARGIAVSVVPVAAHYEKPWGFRSRAFVTIGAPLHVTSDMTIEEINALISQNLKDLAPEYKTTCEQQAAEVCGLAPMLAGRPDAADGLAPLASRWQALEKVAAQVGAATFARLPLVRQGPLARECTILLMGLPFVAALLLTMAPALLAARWAGRSLADDRNVISLMRLLVGIPVLTAWLLVTLVGALLLGALWQWAFLLGLALIGLGTYRPVLHALTLLRNRRHREALWPPYQALIIEKNRFAL